MNPNLTFKNPYVLNHSIPEKKASNKSLEVQK